MSQPFSIAIHGGAGTILREQMSDELKAKSDQRIANEIRRWKMENLKSLMFDIWCLLFEI